MRAPTRSKGLVVASKSSSPSTTARRTYVLDTSVLLADPGALTRFAEEWMLPVAPTHRWPHLVDSRHPHYAGYVGNRVQPKLMDVMRTAG